LGLAFVLEVVVTCDPNFRPKTLLEIVMVLKLSPANSVETRHLKRLREVDICPAELSL